MKKKTVTISCKSIGGSVFQDPQDVHFHCDQLTPIGLEIVRFFDNVNDIKAVAVFTFGDGNVIYGSQDFKNNQEYYAYLNSHGCQCCEVPACILDYIGCDLTYNGCQCCEVPACILDYIGCDLTYNGCLLTENI